MLESLYVQLENKKGDPGLAFILSLMWTRRCSGSIGSATFFAEVEAIFGGKSLEMDLGVQEYLKGEKHQLGRHVTMLLILLVMMIVVSIHDA